MTPFAWHRDELRGLLAERAKFPHALLLHGPAGIGKAEFARSLAASLLCESPRELVACGECPSCHWFGQGNHPDYREVVPESEADDEADAAEAEPARADAKKSLVIKVDQIRAQADFIALSTHRGGFRVLVIRPAEALHAAAANALLKTLEEPPPASAIILVSDQPARLLATIRSRCRRVALSTPPRPEALAWLRGEGVEGVEVALACAGGAPLLARELAQPEQAMWRARVMAELTRPGGADPLAFAAGIDRQGLERTVFWMQTWVLDLVRLRLAGGLRHHEDFLAAARAKARAADLESLFDLDRELRGARRLATHPLNARLLAEHLMMAYNRATSGTAR